MHQAKARDPEAVDPFISWVEPVRDELWPDDWGLHEVSVAYDCATGLVTVHRAESEAESNAWKEATGPNTVTGSVDWWASLPSGEPWIDDLKTGWRLPEVVTPQTLFYLMTRMKVQTEWTTGRISITHWPRAKEPTEPRRYWRQVSSTILLAFEGELKRAWQVATNPDVEPEPRPGAHCLYCPSASICPGLTEGEEPQDTEDTQNVE